MLLFASSKQLNRTKPNLPWLLLTLRFGIYVSQTFPAFWKIPFNPYWSSLTGKLLTKTENSIGLFWRITLSFWSFHGCFWFLFPPNCELSSIVLMLICLWFAKPMNFVPVVVITPPESCNSRKPFRELEDTQCIGWDRLSYVFDQHFPPIISAHPSTPTYDSSCGQQWREKATFVIYPQT